ncbi:helix-turn-helix domain-containing protein [Streptomyces sp. NPDC096339]|uniref:helix-turn-helix transcriptional regulator n=1 Tax=Streptomyces sp. NPDC096339 TaxID=3366086 RepID=UPI0037FF31BC
MTPGPSRFSSGRAENFATGLGEWVCGLSDYQYPRGPVRTRLVVPNTVASVNFGFGHPVRTLSMAGDREYSASPSRVDLPATVAVRARHEGGVHGVVVRMRPMGAYQLFGIPMSEWRHPDFDPADLLPRSLRDLPRRLEDAATGDRAGLLEAALLRLLRDLRAPRVAPEVMTAWRQLHRTRGRIDVGRLAADALCSTRQLERKFKEQIGHPPGAIARTLRFTRALQLQRQGIPLGQVAIRAGFHDQAHYNHVFKKLTGVTPTQLPATGLIDWQSEPGATEKASAPV